MEVSNTLQEVTIQKIDKYYGKIWIKIHKCTTSSKPSTRPDKLVKYGIRLKLRDTQTIKFLLIQGGSF